jgi:S1-C subfamily serine protease
MLAGPAWAAQPRQVQPQAQPAPQPAVQAAAQAEPDPRRTPVVRVVQEAGPAVVTIISTRAEDKAAPFAGGVKIQRLPGDNQKEEQKLQIRTTSQSLGTGVIIDGAKAYVLTIAHVIAGGSKITVRLLDGREYPATLLGADQDMDLAVLRLALPPGAEPLPQARMGDSSDLMIGEPLIAIGNPFGLSHTVTTGVLSAVERSVNTDQRTYTGLIQTDAAINPGNSGGPLLNILGQVVGINAAVYARGGGLGFAIPINKAKRVLDELIATGRVAHIWLGMLGEDMAPEQMAAYGLHRPGGMVVTSVFPGTPAEGAGIKAGDAVLAIGGQRVQDKSQFLGLLQNYTRGDTVGVLLSRGTRQFEVRLKPQELDREAGLGLINWRWGFAPAAAPGGEPGGVPVAAVRQGSPAERLGLKPGDQVLQVGSLRTQTEAELITAFFRYQMHRMLLLSVKRGAQVYTVRMLI